MSRWVLACALLVACGSDGAEPAPEGSGGAATGGAPASGGAAATGGVPVATGGVAATGGAPAQKWFCKMNAADATICSCVGFQPGGFDLSGCPAPACAMFNGTTCNSFSALPAGVASCEAFASLGASNRVVPSCPPP